MKNNKGFSFIEVLVAFSIVMMLVMTILPIISLLQQEETILSDRRHISSVLHDELQSIIWEKSIHFPSSTPKTIRSNHVTFKFTLDNSYIKGCGYWKNMKQRQEEVCFYGIKEK